MLYDLSLDFSAENKKCDILFGGGADEFDLSLDLTPRTALLVSLGSDRRALPDDELPSGVTDGNQAGASPDTRRGWGGDCLDRRQRVIGSRLWLLNRSKQTDDTLVAAEMYAAEALAWLTDDHKITPSIAATWAEKGYLKLAINAGGVTLPIRIRP